MIIPFFKKAQILILLIIFSLPLNAADERVYHGIGYNDFPPYEFLDEYGRPSGFNIEIIRAVAKETGLDLDIRLISYRDAVRNYSEKQSDFITGLFYSDRADNLQFPESLSIPFITVTLNRPGFDFPRIKGSRLSYNSEYGLYPYITKNLSGSKLVASGSDLDSMKSVSMGDSNYAAVPEYSYYYYTKNCTVKNLSINMQPVFSMNYALAVSEDKELQRQFTRGFEIIKQTGEYKLIHLKWFKPYDYNPVEKYVPVLISFLLALAVISILIILFYILLRRQVKNRTQALHKEMNQNYYIADLSRKLLGDASIENISLKVLEYLGELTGSLNGITGYINDGSNTISTFIYSRNNGDIFFKKTDIDSESSRRLKNEIFKNNDSYFLNKPSEIFPDFARPPSHPEVRNVLCSPAMIGGKIAGFIMMGNSARDYNTEDLNTIDNFSSQYSLAIQRMWFEHNLIRSEKKYRDIFNNVEDLLYLYDLEGNFTEVNNAFLKILGYTEDEVRGLNIVWLLTEENSGIYKQEEVKELLSRVFTEGSIRGEVKVKTKSGKSVIIEYKNSLIIDDDGKPAGVRGSARDISERKRFEKMLIEAKEKASESDSMKTTFLANMSHEIRTPLNAVIGFTDILIEEVSDPSHENYLRMIQKSGKLLLSIIDEILDLSRIESGSLKIIEAPFSIKSLIKSLYNSTFILVRSGRKPIEIDFDCDASISTMITGDEYRIEQVMNNLLSNAVKFTDSGEINFGARLAPDKTLEFYVNDTGIGISKENIPLVFERFRQIDFGSRRNYGGTGLGLSISKMIVELMGGRIRVESALHKGSQFIFNIPYKPAPEDKAGTAVRDISLTSNKTVLVVEDNVINRLLVAKILEKNGFNCITAVDGIEAVEAYKNGNPIDIILMDIQMPRMDGLEAVTCIRGMEKKNGSKHIPVVALSAHVMKDDVQKFLESGFDSYISKPFNKEDMIRNIFELIKD